MNNKKRYYKSRGGRSRNTTTSQSPHLSINKVYDSNGPAGKVRGNAHTIYEKYQSLARDAQTSGDRILAENHMQHAEHYLRIIHMIQEQVQTIYKDHPQSQNQTQNSSEDHSEDNSEERDNIQDKQDSSDDTNGSDGDAGKQEVNAPFLRRAPARRKPQRTPKYETDNSDNAEIPSQNEANTVTNATFGKHEQTQRASAQVRIMEAGKIHCANYKDAV